MTTLEQTEKATHAPGSTLKFHYPEHWHATDERRLRIFGQPTHVTFNDSKNDLEYHWDSRSHRKGKAPVAKDSSVREGKHSWKTRRAAPRLVGIDFNDISWWIAILFLVGSIFWCANGIMAFNYFDDTSVHIGLCEAVTAFLGGTFFVVGAYLSFVESLNPAQDTNFGWIIDQEAKELIEPKRSEGSLGRGRSHFGRHVAPSAASDPEKARPDGSPSSGAEDTTAITGAGSPAKSQPWRWFGTDWSSLGFTANAIQLYGATVFEISVLCGLPGILPVAGAQVASGLPSRTLGLWEGLYWLPQILGAPGFIISGYMFCFEVQTKWYKPKLNSLGWHLGFWNLMGGFGFWFCGIFGVLRETGGADQRWGSAFSTFWGSWFFLIASYIQWYESLNKR